MPPFFNRIGEFWALPYSVQWRALFVRMPWLTPLAALRITSPEGPHPSVIQLPSRQGDYQIPVYIFPPPIPEDNPKEHEFSLPVHLDFHGGGFIMGSCLEQAPFCAMLVRKTGRLVLSIDYRKGPLDQFPSAIEDAEDVLAAILDSSGQTKAGKVLRREIDKLYSSAMRSPVLNLDPDRISISGFSSGGNIALNLVLSVSTPNMTWPTVFPSTPEKIPLLLFYPSLDARELPSERPRPSNVTQPRRIFSDMDSYLMPTYLPVELRSHPRASPGLADITAEKLHPAAQMLLVLPEVDSLAEQSAAWIQKVRKAEKQNQLEVIQMSGMKHGWTQFPDFFLTEHERDAKRQIFSYAAEFLNRF